MPVTSTAFPRPGWRGCGKAWRRLTPRFSADRAVREYTEQHYLPAAAAYRERAADKGALGKQIVDWRHALEQKWAALRFGEVKVETSGEQHVFEVQVYLDELDPDAVRVELYADGSTATARCGRRWSACANGGRGRRLRLSRVGAGDPPGGRLYAASHTAPPGVAVPLEAARILWQR